MNNHKVGDLVCRFGPHWSEGEKLVIGVIYSKWTRYDSIVETRYLIDWASSQVSSWKDGYSEHEVVTFKRNLKVWLQNENKH